MSEPQVIAQRDGPVGIALLHRPSVLNALSNDVLDELATVLESFDNDDEVRVVIVTGGPQGFAAGADRRQFAEADVPSMMLGGRWSSWDRVKRIRKPLIAAVAGFALGGGCELAMHCDLIVAAESARFGQPEINVGIMPGAGGTQRLTRAVGKARAMELVLTGEYLGAAEAHARGLVNRVTPPELFLEAAQQLARQVAARPPLAVRLAKDAVLKAQDLSIEEG